VQPKYYFIFIINALNTGCAGWCTAHQICSYYINVSSKNTSKNSKTHCIAHCIFHNCYPIQFWYAGWVHL